MAQNLSYRLFKNVGSKRDSPLQINCKNFTIGCTVAACVAGVEGEGKGKNTPAVVSTLSPSLSTACHAG